MNESVEYRDKTFLQFWKTERFPFLLTLPFIFGLGTSIFLIIQSFQTDIADLVGGSFFLAFTLIGYSLYYSSTYNVYRKGHLIYSAITEGNKQILKEVKLYNGNVVQKFPKVTTVMEKGVSFPFYDFTCNSQDLI